MRTATILIEDSIFVLPGETNENDESERIQRINLGQCFGTDDINFILRFRRLSSRE